MVARAGAGPPPTPFKELTAEGLANAILEALKPETLQRARELGERSMYFSEQSVSFFVHLCEFQKYNLP